MNVLIIEDNPLVALDLKEIVMSLGIQNVSIARDEASIIDAISCFSPDLCLVDIHLDQGVNGIEVVKKYEKLRAAAVIYLVGDSNQSLMEEAGKTDPISLFKKPYDESEIIAVMENLISTKALT